MLEISYQRSSGAIAKGWTDETVDFAHVAHVDLFYSLFGCHFKIRAGAIEFDSRHRVAAILDLALSLASIAKRIKDGEQARYSLKEWDDWISFYRNGEEVYVACSFAPGIGRVIHAELVSGVRSFLLAAWGDVSAIHPVLYRNADLQRAFSRVGESALLGSTNEPG